MVVCETTRTTSGLSMLSKNKVALSSVAVALEIVATLNIIVSNASTSPSASMSAVEIVIVPESEFAGIVIFLLLKV